MNVLGRPVGDVKVGQSIITVYRVYDGNDMHG